MANVTVENTTARMVQLPHSAGCIKLSPGPNEVDSEELDDVARRSAERAKPKKGTRKPKGGDLYAHMIDTKILVVKGAKASDPDDKGDDKGDDKSAKPSPAPKKDPPKSGGKGSKPGS